MNNDRIEYVVPAKYGTAELVEKRSRFIGQVWNVSSENEAREFIAQTKSKYYDARHNCWCYIIRDGGAVRYSDDGEPQGTAGQPMLEVFKRSGIENVCCVVTRYFGGILLGAGGLVRAYSASAKLALDAAGISVMGMWSRFLVDCPYSLLDRVKAELSAIRATIEQTEYSSAVLLTVLIPQGSDELFAKRMGDISSGGIDILPDGTVFKAVPVNDRT